MSYSRGNWRKESTSAPSLLAKTCHDIDILYWLLAAGAPGSAKPVHVPRDISSAGSLQYFKKSRKPAEAGAATNCFSCEYEPSCQFSAKRIYTSQELAGRPEEGWTRIVCPEIEDCIATKGAEAGQEALFGKLREDYGPETPAEEVSKRSWYGRCVYEGDNDVCDNQTVTLSWKTTRSRRRARRHCRRSPAAAARRRLCTWWHSARGSARGSPTSTAPTGRYTRTAPPSRCRTSGPARLRCTTLRPG